MYLLLEFAICGLVIQSVHASNHIYGSFSPAPNNVQCAQGEDCYVQCHGKNSCVFTLHNVYGPTGYKLTVDVDSKRHEQSGSYTFNGRIYCSSCSALDIRVRGGGYLEFVSNGIYTPDAGNTVFDCTGATVTGGSAVCYGMKFYGINGFGSGPGQVRVVDTSSTPGRISLNAPVPVNYYCWWNNILHATCQSNYLAGMIWNNGYLQCGYSLSCQATPIPTSSPTQVTINTIKAHPGEKTPYSGPMNVMGTDGFVNISIIDYYIMRMCEFIVAVGICIGFVVAFCKLIKGCNGKRYSYAKVMYDTEASEIEI